jgi:glycosyltransferase involved in cell wall biosynthesis
LRAHGWAVHAFDWRARFDPMTILRLMRLCREQHIDILHSHSARANLHARLAGRLAGVRVVSTVHNSVFAYEVSAARQRAYAALERWSARWAERVVAVSHGIADDLISRYRIPAAKVAVIPNGVDLERLQARRTCAAVRTELGIPLSAPLVVQAGRFTRQKGFDVLLEAAAHVRLSQPDIRVLCVGDGPERARLAVQTAGLGLTSCVRFMGRTDALPDVLAAADVVTLASRSEGLPYVLLEAMGLGRPVIGTRIPGIAEVVEDQRSGLLVSPEDPQALGTAILALLNEPPRRLAFGHAGRHRVQAHFTAETMARSLGDVYRDDRHPSGIRREAYRRPRVT